MDKVEAANLIEELGANAWPAPVQQQLEGWRLRAGFGASRRDNSVMAVGPAPRIEGWQQEVIDFYRRWELPVRYHITAASPPDLDSMLAAMGYTKEGETLVQGASCRDALAGAGNASPCEMVLYNKLEPEWLEAFMEIEDHPPAKRRGYVEIMSRIGPRCLFALARVDGEPVSVGTAVLERGWAGLFNVAVAPGHRRGGIGTQTMRALTSWASENGAANLYLQVLGTNEPALNLYEKLCFNTLYTYHYRTL